MGFKRLLNHLLMTDWQVKRAFAPSVLAKIEQAIQASELAHAGEIRFAVEGALGILPLVEGQDARSRAIEVFSQLHVWDTQHNNGLLIYVLLADRAVEIVADRGINARVQPGEWDAVCQAIKTAFGNRQFEAGSVAGIDAVSSHLARHFPAHPSSGNELPDQPVVL